MQILSRRQSRILKGGLLTFFIAVTNSKNGRHVAITSTNSIRTAHMSATNQTISLNQLESGLPSLIITGKNLSIIRYLAFEFLKIPTDAKTHIYHNIFLTQFCDINEQFNISWQGKVQLQVHSLMNIYLHGKQHCATAQPYIVDGPFSRLLFILDVVDHFLFDDGRFRLHY